MKCQNCKKILGRNNKTGFCTSCYPGSPQSLKYQRLKQREWYSKKENKAKKINYNQKPKVKARNKRYQKIYQKENIERMRELKRNWARKHKK